MKVDKSLVVALCTAATAIGIFLTLEQIRPAFLFNLAIACVLELSFYVPYQLHNWGIIGKKNGKNRSTGIQSQQDPE